MRTWACQWHRDDQNRACLRGRGPVLPHCGIYKSCPEFETIVYVASLGKRRSQPTWERMMTVGIDPSFRTICLATWVCHVRSVCSYMAPAVEGHFDLATC